MQVFPIRSNSNNASFKGVTESGKYNDWSLRNSSNWHKNSSVDRTLGSYHANPTYKAYFADPMEKVSDFIKQLLQPTQKELKSLGRKNSVTSPPNLS